MSMAANTAQIDLTGERVGAIYGKAFFGAAESSGAMAAAVEEFESLITEVVDPNPEFERLLANQMIGCEDKIKMLDRIFAPTASTGMLSFLKVLAENERLGYLRPILRQVYELNNQRLNRVRVDARTAMPLEPAIKNQLRQRVRDLLGKEAELIETVDSDMIGGIVLRIGDTVFDGSVNAELERMRKRILARNIEQIETNRDRFQFDSNPL